MQADPSDSQIYAADEDVDMPEVEAIPDSKEVEVVPDDKSSRQVEVIEHGGRPALVKGLFQDGNGNPDPVASNAMLRRQLGKAAVNYVVRLHRNLGHPSSNALCKMLEEFQAGVPPAGLTAQVFGERLMSDTAWIDTDDGRVCVMT